MPQSKPYWLLNASSIAAAFSVDVSGCKGLAGEIIKPPPFQLRCKTFEFHFLFHQEHQKE